jgi:GWxTD domain-containing protein
VLVSMSFAPRYLAFAREDDQYAGRYTVRLEIRNGPNLVRQVEAKETVRVATFRETSRTDESLIWQQYVRVAPGQYTLGIALRDDGSPRSSAEEVSLQVPRLAAGSLASPIPVYETVPRSVPDSLPRLLARPRATITFGVDSAVPIYLEIAGSRQATSVRAQVLGEGDALLWQDSTVLLGRGGDLLSGVMQVPAANIGVGVVTLQVNQANSPDTVRTKLLVTLGEDLPVTGFEEMIGYLRFYAPDYKLKRLTETTGVERAKAWNEFLKSTDPNPGTAEHEGLRDYFARIRLANQRFRDDGPIGWLSDRGMAFVGLGDPDNIMDSQNMNDLTTRNRQQVWTYSRWRLQLVFFDQTGLGRWRLSPGGSGELAATIRRRLAELP